MDSLVLRAAALGLAALSFVGCGRRGPLGDEVMALRTTVDSSNTVLQSLDSAEFMNAFNRMERHIEIAKTKTYDSARDSIFREDFEWLRNSHRALYKFETLRRGEEWDRLLIAAGTYPLGRSLPGQQAAGQQLIAGGWQAASHQRSCASRSGCVTWILPSGDLLIRPSSAKRAKVCETH